MEANSERSTTAVTGFKGRETVSQKLVPPLDPFCFDSAISSLSLPTVNKRENKQTQFKLNKKAKRRIPGREKEIRPTLVCLIGK